MRAGLRSRRERSNSNRVGARADAPQDKKIGEMPVRNMKFVLVNNMVPRRPSVCTACSRPLERGYLHDLSTSKRYCGIEATPNGCW